ncbi:MAG: hypothetical protein KF817_07555 [Phycisphaeraceae bacterium]|nr:hypothetical protein [Phycisphaeraceae bacterium]
MKPSLTTAAGTAVLLSLLAACGKEAPAPTATRPAAPAAAADHDDHDHDHDAAGGHGYGHHGEPVELGTTRIGAYQVHAARDEGAVTAGGDVPIDVRVDGDVSGITAVRFWIGTEDGDGAMRARGEREDPSVLNHWHAHADVPDPMPADSRLWVELELRSGERVRGSFDLHQ